MFTNANVLPEASAAADCPNIPLPLCATSVKTFTSVQLFSAASALSFFVNSVL